MHHRVSAANTVDASPRSFNLAHSSSVVGGKSLIQGEGVGGSVTLQHRYVSVGESNCQDILVVDPSEVVWT